MSIPPGTPIAALDTPALLLDLDAIDANLGFLQRECDRRNIALRVHFKSLKCGGLARYLAARGVSAFLAAKLNEVETLLSAGVRDILLANEIVTPTKISRLASLAKSGDLAVCVDDADNVRALGAAVTEAGSTLGVLIEVDVGMRRCGVAPGAPVLELASLIQHTPGLHFRGLQGYEGHLQQIADAGERRSRCLAAVGPLIESRKLLETAGIVVPVVTGGGTGTWEFYASVEGVTEIQPGSFLLMDCFYHRLRPEFACSLSILTTVVSRRENWYVLDAGSKAISQDFGVPAIKSHTTERVVKLVEEHTRVEVDRQLPAIGSQREVLPAHCCATMNLHRVAIATRGGKVEAVWPIESSGRYD
jgi:D-serine deaminase-like pyridoxal phosphate-dependent protein